VDCRGKDSKGTTQPSDDHGRVRNEDSGKGATLTVSLVRNFRKRGGTIPDEIERRVHQARRRYWDLPRKGDLRLGSFHDIGKVEGGSHLVRNAGEENLLEASWTLEVINGREGVATLAPELGGYSFKRHLAPSSPREGKLARKVCLITGGTRTA